ncbi:MAG TPA: GNAT family N-acetyltransferase [Solirubrobacteraceae bacterium]|nr:GNAT family N-acetyltransferase [Solirubrobacteraceae bacterium]
MSAVDAYPAEQSVDVALRDGSTIHVRPVRPDDRDGIEALLRSMSNESLYLRCFGSVNPRWLADWSVDVDYAGRYGVVATTGLEQEIVAHGAYVRFEETRAEVAFEVADRMQGHGIATLLLAHLAGIAARNGIFTFTAEVLPSNHKMLEVFRTSGFPTTMRAIRGVTEVEFPTELSAETLEAFERREREATVGAIRHVLAPSAVAVIGVSRRPEAVGSVVFANLIASGYRGPLYPVSRHLRSIRGIRCHRSIADLPGPVELAVIAVPASEVIGVASECGRHGIKALVVLTAGFAETGELGADRQHELLSVCRGSGMRLIGPNCLGVINTDPQVRLNATFAGGPPPGGNIGFLSQSGGLGIALIEEAAGLGLGLSSFVSAGNKADISGNDLLEYWEQDPCTDVILLYLESFGNPRRFARVARRVSRSKPILAVKSGRTRAGARAAASHTAALVSASDISVDALFRQAGVIRVDTIGELLNTATLLGSQPLPRGGRVGIVTNGGGPGILCADACQAAGLEVCELPESVRRQLTSFLPAGASVANPIDMIATASAKDYRRVIETLVQANACDAVLTLFVPPLMTRADDVREQVRKAAVGAASTVTLASVYMDRELPEDGAAGTDVPEFRFPEDAVSALSHAVRYANWRERPGGVVPPSAPQSSRAAVAAIIERALAAGKEWLSPAEVDAALRCYDLPLLPSRIVRTAPQANAAAKHLGYPVALKAIASGLLHKRDAGGVRLDLRSPSEVTAAAGEIRKAVRAAGHRLEGLIVQSMAEPGVEFLAGVVHDPSFGPLIAFGAGGTNAELLGDIALRITPLTDLEAAEMVRSLRSSPLLDGYRGAPRCDVAALERLLLALSALVEAHPEVAELDFNPVIAGPAGSVIADARIRVRRAAPEPPLAALSA